MDGLAKFSAGDEYFMAPAVVYAKRFMYVSRVPVCSNAWIT